jgi:penicillin amidase
VKRLLLVVALLVIFAAGGTAIWAARHVRASLPLLDGEVTLRGLSAPASAERDALGVPRIRAASRADAARVTGFLHAQERYFQMDLQRRRAAGELAALVGAAALPLDRSVRVHRFRHRAHQRFASASPEERSLIEAYRQGVNEGLAGLGAPPFEYALLGVDPEPWRPEDALLSAFAMYLELQDDLVPQESALGVMHEVLPGPLFALLAPPGTSWDAPLQGGPMPAPEIPGPQVFDLRQASVTDADVVASMRVELVEEGRGSNNWAVAGSHTDGAGALVADDMHLVLGVPNIWYRASLEFPGASGEERRITGATLPGTPAVVVGSNGFVTWGFTNSHGDWGDLVLLETVSDDTYLTPDGPRPFERSLETLEVLGGEAETLEVLDTIWGPVIGRDHRGRLRAQRWVAHDEGAVNLGLVAVESSRTLDEALRAANRAGVPAQNFVAGDRDGRIGWTIIGPVPRRFGHDGLVPTSWADGTRGWNGYLTPDEVPRIIDPPSGRLWTANTRVVNGRDLDLIGFGNYSNGARARQIRDGLMALENATERDLLAIQLDNRALFLERWRNLLLRVLNEDAVAANPRLAPLRDRVLDWGGRASVASVGYRGVRRFRKETAQRVLLPLAAPCRTADPIFELDRASRQLEAPLWKLVSERPEHLRDPRYASWEDLLLEAAEATREALESGGNARVDQTWGALNSPEIRHPLSRFVPLLSGWLDMPVVGMPGDAHMPLAQTTSWGVSQRMVVSPGREEDAIFHMPAGQSGHPLSPFYRAGHDDWVNGKPTPLLPGPARHRLRFQPAS